MSIRKFFRSIFNSALQRGQVMVLYALLIPLLFLFVGVGMDLGWYYLTVSRLQNAADAAVLAGAYKLVEEENDLRQYFVKVLTDPPDDITEYHKVRFNGQIKDIDEDPGIAEAQKYSGKNLGTLVEGESLDSSTIFDDWNTSADIDLHKVSISTALYTKIIDAQWREDSIRYYRVTLREKVNHLFLRGFEPMDATVTAYALLRPHDVDLITVIKQLEDNKVIANWQYQNQYKDFDGKWNHYRQTGTNNAGASGQKTISYTAGDYFRTETVNVEIAKGDGSNNGFSEKSKRGTSSGQATSANGNSYYSELEVDTLNIDFNQDISTQFSTDWDLGADLPAGKKLGYIQAAMDGWDATNGADLRIQGRINFRDAWRNRNLMDDDKSNDLTPDILWVRIESDPWWSTKAILPWLTGNTSNEGWDSVHQMIISIDKDNTESTDKAFKFSNDKKKVNGDFVDGDFDGYEIEDGLAYKYRPLFIFYKGPETYAEDNGVRQSQPVILNLNTNFNGILYAPNSPVVILGNENTWHGFVVAKEFVRLKEVSDYTKIGYKEYKNLNDKPILVKPEEVFSETGLDDEYPEEDYVKKKSEDGNTIKFYELAKAPKYFIIDPRYVKGVAGHTETAYVNALKKYRDLRDAEIVQITFPEKDPLGSLNNTQAYSVAYEDLLDKVELPESEPDPDDAASVNNANSHYVPVIYNGARKYIAKTNLPFVRVYRKSDGDRYPYVPVCDLKQKTTSGTETNYNGVTLADDRHNAYTNGELTDAQYKIDDNKDMWKIPKASMTNIQNLYDSNAKTAKITRRSETDTDEVYSFFTTKTEETAADEANTNAQKDDKFFASYQRITDNGADKYIRSDNESYFTYVNYQTFQDQPDKGRVIQLVMSSNGTVQTKPLLKETDYFDVTDSYKFQPCDRGWNKKIMDLETGKNTKEYRVPEFEVVYRKSAFDLNEDSSYSWFQITDSELNVTLHRINYTYMNVDELNHTSENNLFEDDWDVEDMFFTARRASWID